MKKWLLRILIVWVAAFPCVAGAVSINCPKILQGVYAAARGKRLSTAAVPT